MVDRNWKLLVGRSKDIPFTYLTFRHTDIIRTFTRIVNSKIFLSSKNMYLFYPDYLLWGIGNCLADLNNHKCKFGSNILIDINEVLAFSR
jgi:hypothetical protein